MEDLEVGEEPAPEWLHMPYSTCLDYRAGDVFWIDHCNCHLEGGFGETDCSGPGNRLLEGSGDEEDTTPAFTL